MYNIEKKKVGGDLFVYFSWGCVYGTIQVLFGYTQVWEEQKDAYTKGPDYPLNGPSAHGLFFSRWRFQAGKGRWVYRKGDFGPNRPA